MIQKLIALGGLFLFAIPGFAQEDNHLQDFKSKLIWRGPLVKTLIAAGIAQAFDSPKEWGHGIDGFGKRAGNFFGQRVVKAGVEYGVSGLTHEDLHYRRLGSGNFFVRLEHAVVGTYWVQRDNGAGNTFAAGRLAGSFAAPEVARLWLPARVATNGYAMQTAAGIVGLDVGLNIFYEFVHHAH